MGKQGPCYHCGATSTPLWRNGPPEKPVLCNACGSRWRTKGSLANYTPLHARTEHDDFEDYRMARVRIIAIKNKEARGLKRKQSHDNAELGTFASDGNQGLYKGFDEDTSNRSSSGSAISNSESCAQFGGETSDLTVVSGPGQNIVWDSMVPSKKRTGVTRPKQSPVEKLTKDLCTILHEQQSSCFSGSSEDDLLYESDKPMVSVEIGHGSVLIRHPSYVPREEDSEASSLSVDNKLHPVNEAYSRLTNLPVHNNSKGIKLPSPETEAIRKPAGQFIMEQGQTKRDQPGKRQMLGHQNSLLCSVSLKEIVNLDEFVSRLTRDEQLQLLKYLPSIDTSGPPESLKSMFQSRQFEDSLSTFQKLLAEGVLDNTPPEATTEGHRMLKKFLFCNLTKSKWVEKYTSLKDGMGKSSTCTSEGAGEYNVIATGHSANAKRIRDGQDQKFPGANATVRSPKRSMMKVNHDNGELIDNDGLVFTPKNLFSSDNCSVVLDSFQSGDTSYDQDLLLDVPSNSSFPQAELLLPTSSFAGHASTSCSSVYPHLGLP